MDEYPNLFRQENFLSEPTYYVVKNHEMGEWLKRYLADKFGTVLGLRILEIVQAIQKFNTWYGSSVSHRKMMAGNKMSSYSDATSDTSTMADTIVAKKTSLSRGEMKLAIYKALEELLAGKTISSSPYRTILQRRLMAGSLNGSGSLPTQLRMPLFSMI